MLTYGQHIPVSFVSQKFIHVSWFGPLFYSCEKPKIIAEFCFGLVFDVVALI